MEAKNCNCLKESEEKIIEHAISRKNNPKGYSITTSDWEHKSIYPTERLYTNYKIKSSFIKKDGTVSTTQHEQICILFSYCPFCGKKYEDE